MLPDKVASSRNNEIQTPCGDVLNAGDFQFAPACASTNSMTCLFQP
ncbi:hypothetical protein ACS15_0099 [Ralstonia insidiosa]|uniref:Uncharacterized protein n=1 Tax=Ralstonia insidiosa TaxID=190721 RepID=A0AAC9BGD9_9RALS|nr:hypothetical protein ACS15_0099 [Ralstonia insidiosa]